MMLAAALWGAETEIQVRHEHLRKSCAGTLRVTDEGLAFKGAKQHSWTWKFRDIQQLTYAPDRITVVSYQDNKRKLGADRSYTFTGEFPRALYTAWSAKLDQRFVAAVADTPADGVTLAVKHLGRIQGSEGELKFGADRIVYATEAHNDSRTWRYQDIENISSSGPFQLTLTTFERARSHYGDRKGFNFQLKQALNEAQYNQLWLDIQKKNGRIQP